jgi:hypothetical protein
VYVFNRLAENNDARMNTLSTERRTFERGSTVWTKQATIFGPECDGSYHDDNANFGGFVPMDSKSNLFLGRNDGAWESIKRVAEE